MVPWIAVLFALVHSVSPTCLVAWIYRYFGRMVGDRNWTPAMVVHGILRTRDAASPISYDMVLTSLILFVVVYAVVFSMGIYYINRLIEKGPAGAMPDSDTGTAARPFSAATEATRAAIVKED